MKSWVEISAARLAANYRAIQSAAGEDVEVLGVIKANAYGHDALLCGRVLIEAGARWLGVADVEEALRLRGEPGFAHVRILLMSAIEPADAPAILEHNLTPIVWSENHLAALEAAAQTAGRPVRVHLEIDTGMARMGASLAELAAVARRLAESSWLKLEGLMTHLASAEVVASAATAAQLRRFQQARGILAEAGLTPEFLHLANSSAIDDGAALRWLREQAGPGVTVLARPGIAMYGYILPLEHPGDEQGEALPSAGVIAPKLQPVMTWKTRVMALRELEAGQRVGYGGTFAAPRPMRVALLPTGYSDGFRRSASSGPPPDWQRGWVMVRGQRAHVLGRVSMNLTVVDVTEIPGVLEGDEVTLLGDGVTANDHAVWAGTISYEILCGVRAARYLLA